MNARTKHTRNFIIVFSLSIMTAWLILPRAIRHAVEPTALAAAKTFTVNVIGDGVDANPGDGFCLTSGNTCSLRAAIQEANANAGKDTINFNLPGAAVHTISPDTALPSITEAATIDGYSQPGSSPNTLANGDNAVLLIELSGVDIPSGSFTSGLHASNSGGVTTIQGLVIHRFVDGISTDPGSRQIIQGNFIGTDSTGHIALPNTEDGIQMLSSNTTVGGITPAARNLISGNGRDGVLDIGVSNQIQGNFIGTDVTGTAALGNARHGVNDPTVPGKELVGGTDPGAGNVISGNQQSGIALEGSNNVVQGNLIGTDVTGTAKLGNGEAGVLLTSNVTTDNTISGNLISGNSRGVEILFGSGNKIQSNLIGTDITGQHPLGNGYGVHIVTVNNNLIGGPLGTGNTIAFNGIGILIDGQPAAGNAVLSNSIFSNTGLGIDLAPTGMTPNDIGDTDTGPNNLQNFPVISSAITNGSSTIVTGATDSTPNTGITIQFFANPGCDPAGNGEGQTFVGSINQTTGADGHFMFSATMMSNVAVGQFITATATDSGNNTSEFSACVQVMGASPTPTPTPTATPTPTPLVSTLQFSQPFFSTFEDCAATTIIVTRIGDTSQAATVDYATQSGTAVDRADFNAAAGTLRFASGETAKSFDVLITEDSFAEGTESFTIALTNPAGATLGSPASVSVEIFDDAPESTTNPIDTADDFVCQHYHDFLNREEDSLGAAFWTNEITGCGNNAGCIQQKRVNTSGAFFLSIEFQETGGFAIRVQRAAFGKRSVDAATRISYAQFIRDGRFLGEGVVVGQTGWDAKLEANKQAYINQVAASATFNTKYSAGLTADQFVDALFAAASVTPTSSERQAAINAFDGGGISARAAALRSVSDSSSLRAAEFNPSFVLLQYFGYLRRNPTDAPDNNDNGYQFWLTKLNSFNGDFVQAEMVKAFITSLEYRGRFGPP